MDFTDFLILKLIFMFVAAIVYGFWRAWKGFD